jgi:hypothetical protein
MFQCSLCNCRVHKQTVHTFENKTVRRIWGDELQDLMATVVSSRRFRSDHISLIHFALMRVVGSITVVVVRAIVFWRCDIWNGIIVIDVIVIGVLERRNILITFLSCELFWSRRMDVAFIWTLCKRNLFSPISKSAPRTLLT